MSNTLTIELGEGIDQEEARRFLALALFQHRKISVGAAAKVAGMSYESWLEWLGSMNIVAFEYEDDLDLAAELKLIEDTRS